MHPYALSLLGGVLIGLSASITLLFLGRIAGISGILFGLLPNVHEKVEAKALRIAFLAGLVITGATLAWIDPHLFSPSPTSLPLLAVAGFLVGVGTRIGGGCTSGHGVCGLSRGSVRSLVGTVTFIAFGAITVWVRNHIRGVL